jgi:hypothetical protein
MTTKRAPTCTDAAPDPGARSDKQGTDEAAKSARSYEMPVRLSPYYLRGLEPAREFPQPTA